MEGVGLYFQSVLQQSDAVTDALREENEVLKNQIQDLTEQVQSKGEADDVIMVAVNQKVDEWQVSFFQVSFYYGRSGWLWGQNVLLMLYVAYT